MMDLNRSPDNEHDTTLLSGAIASFDCVSALGLRMIGVSVDVHAVAGRGQGPNRRTTPLTLMIIAEIRECGERLKSGVISESCDT